MSRPNAPSVPSPARNPALSGGVHESMTEATAVSWRAEPVEARVERYDRPMAAARPSVISVRREAATFSDRSNGPQTVATSSYRGDGPQAVARGTDGSNGSSGSSGSSDSSGSSSSSGSTAPSSAVGSVEGSSVEKSGSLVWLWIFLGCGVFGLLAVAGVFLIMLRKR